MPRTINRPFPAPDPDLIAISIAYRNAMLIADRMLPRKPIGKEEFKYQKYPQGQFITIPDTKAGRKGELNEVDFEGDEVTDSVIPYGLKAPIPKSDIDNAPEGMSPRDVTTEGLRDLVLLDREVRVAGLVFDATQYAAANKVQLSGTDQWSDYTNSTPVEDIKAALNAPFYRPNKMTIGQAAWSKLRSHPAVISSVNRNSGEKGIASKSEVADLFEIEEINVGRGWVNIAKPGQAVQRKRVWGKHCLLYYDNAAAQPQLGFGMTFGFTAQQGDPIAGSKQVGMGDMGLEGGEEIINGEKVKEVIAANDLAYFIEDCIA